MPANYLISRQNIRLRSRFDSSIRADSSSSLSYLQMQKDYFILQSPFCKNAISTYMCILHFRTFNYFRRLDSNRIHHNFLCCYDTCRCTACTVWICTSVCIYCTTVLYTVWEVSAQQIADWCYLQCRSLCVVFFSLNFRMWL